MLNFQLNGTVSKMTKDFSEYVEVNTLMYGRCMLALTTRSTDDLCKEINMKVLRGKKLTEVQLSSTEIKERLNEIGLWQVISNAVTKASPEFVRMLDHMLLGSFGYAEVESVVRHRALEAVEKRSMKPLYQEIDAEWRNGKFKLSAEEMKEALIATGIWQLVETEIK